MNGTTDVKLKVKVGTLQFEQGTFEKGSVIVVTEERAKLFSPADVEFTDEKPAPTRTDLERPMIRFIREKRGVEPLTGVEIGVCHGANARNILENLNVTQLFLIDPYESYIENGNRQDPLDAEEVAHKNLEDHKPRIVWLKGSSSDPVVLSQVPKVDFVYIDGAHNYEQVKADIMNYGKKIKERGVLGGHDYDWESVSRAVNELIPSEFLQHECLPHIGCDWWVNEAALV